MERKLVCSCTLIDNGLVLTWNLFFFPVNHYIFIILYRGIWISILRRSFQFLRIFWALLSFAAKNQPRIYHKIALFQARQHRSKKYCSLALYRSSRRYPIRIVGHDLRTVWSDLQAPDLCPPVGQCQTSDSACSREWEEKRDEVVELVENRTMVWEITMGNSTE